METSDLTCLEAEWYKSRKPALLTSSGGGRIMSSSPPGLAGQRRVSLLAVGFPAFELEVSEVMMNTNDEILKIVLVMKAHASQPQWHQLFRHRLASI